MVVFILRSLPNPSLSIRVAYYNVLVYNRPMAERTAWQGNELRGSERDRFLAGISLGIDRVWRSSSVPLSSESYRRVAEIVPRLGQVPIVRAIELSECGIDRWEYVGNNVVVHHLLKSVVSALNLVGDQNPGVPFDELGVIGVGMEASAQEIKKAVRSLRLSSFPDPWEGPQQVHKQTAAEARRMIAEVKGVNVGWVANLKIGEALSDCIEISGGRLGRLRWDGRDRVILPETDIPVYQDDLIRALRMYPAVQITERELEKMGGSVSSVRKLTEVELEGLPEAGDPYSGFEQVARVEEVRGLVRALPPAQQKMICQVFEIDLDGNPYETPRVGRKTTNIKLSAEELGLRLEEGRSEYYKALNAIRRVVTSEL